MKISSILVVKAMKVILLIYSVTLTLLIVDSGLTAKRVFDYYQALRNENTSSGELGNLAKDLQRYSRVIDSPIWLPVKELIGERRALADLSITIGAGARALEILAPSIESLMSEDNLGSTEIIAHEYLVFSKVRSEIQLALKSFTKIEFLGLFSPLNKRLDKLKVEAVKYELAFERVSPLFPIIPSLLGSLEERTYFIGMQNSAQSRGTGGLLGTFAIVTFDKGKITIDHLAPNSELEVHPDIPIEVPSEYRLIYKDYAKSWNGSNFSPHFPYAAKIWAETWRKMTGERVDGVISLDTYLLKALISASGPVELDGYRLDSENVIEELLSKAYSKFESSPEKRKTYLTEVARIIADRFIEGNYSKATLLQKITDLILENRFNLYLANPEEANHLNLSLLAGTLDNKPNNEYRLVLQNISGNKLDYYIERELSIVSQECNPFRTTRVEVTIKNTANPETPLPPYVNSLRAQGFPNGKRNAQFAGIFLYGPTNSKIKGVVDVDTGKSYGWINRERERTFYSAQVMIPAGTSKRFLIYFEGGTGKITTITQPLVIPQKTAITDTCAS